MRAVSFKVSPFVRLEVVAEMLTTSALRRNAANSNDVRVLVLHRPVPPKAAFREKDAAALAAPLRQPLRARLDGIEVRYVPFLAPPTKALVVASKSLNAKVRSRHCWGAGGVHSNWASVAS